MTRVCSRTGWRIERRRPVLHGSQHPRDDRPLARSGPEGTDTGRVSAELPCRACSKEEPKVLRTRRWARRPTHLAGATRRLNVHRLLRFELRPLSLRGPYCMAVRADKIALGDLRENARMRRPCPHADVERLHFARPMIELHALRRKRSAAIHARLRFLLGKPRSLLAHVLARTYTRGRVRVCLGACVLLRAHLGAIVRVGHLPDRPLAHVGVVSQPLMVVREGLP